MRIEHAVLIASFSVCVFARAARADEVTDYYAVRSLPELGSVIIERGFFRGKVAHQRARSRRNILARKGIFVADSSRVAKHKLRFKLGKRWLAIALTITPPPERDGDGNANHRAAIRVDIDRETKIDTLFGYHADLRELDFKRIVLFEDGTIYFEATFNDDHGNMRSLFLDDFGWYDTKEQLAKKLDTAGLKAAVAAQGKRRPGTAGK